VDASLFGSFLASGPLRYPSIPDLIEALKRDTGVAMDSLASDQPFPGEMMVNSACFIDFMIPRLNALWRAKLQGTGLCGRADWDAPGTILGNWYRADVTDPSFANMASIEANSLSFSPYNIDPLNQDQIGVGSSFVANAPSVISSILVDSARQRLLQPLRFTPDRSAGATHNPDPSLVGTDAYACFDIPDPSAALPNQALLVWHTTSSGIERLRVLYAGGLCTTILTNIAADPARLITLPWWGDYIR
jgi:hypothetical protein